MSKKGKGAKEKLKSERTARAAETDKNICPHFKYEIGDTPNVIPNETFVFVLQQN